MTFRWIPRTTPDETALSRLEHHFPKPSDPPPQAWFMQEISYYPSIVEEDVKEIPIREMELYLGDTSGGLRAFPALEWAQQRWRATFHYLLPRLIQRCHESYLLSDLIGYFFHVYPDTIPNVYPEYRSDVLTVLGGAVMNPAFWGEGDLSETIIQREWDYYHLYGSSDFRSTLSPAIYFCVKYLTPSEIDVWAESILQIKGNYWNFHLISWIFHETFHLLLRFDEANLPASQLVKPEAEIGVNAFVSEFEISTANVQAFIKKLKEYNLFRSLST